MSSKKLISILLCLMIVTAVPLTASAYTWTGYKTFSLKSTDSYKATDMNGNDHSDTKESGNTVVEVKASAMTMYNNPVFRIVSGKSTSSSPYCNGFKMANAGTKKSVSGVNTASKGAICYANIKPSVLQTGTDTVKFKFSAD